MRLFAVCDKPLNGSLVIELVQKRVLCKVTPKQCPAHTPTTLEVDTAWVAVEVLLPAVVRDPAKLHKQPHRVPLEFAWLDVAAVAMKKLTKRLFDKGARPAPLALAKALEQRGDIADIEACLDLVEVDEVDLSIVTSQEVSLVSVAVDHPEGFATERERTECVRDRVETLERVGLIRWKDVTVLHEFLLEEHPPVLELLTIDPLARCMERTERLSCRCNQSGV